MNINSIEAFINPNFHILVSSIIILLKTPSKNCINTLKIASNDF